MKAATAPSSHYLRPDQAARIIGVSRDSIYRWIRLGYLDALKISRVAVHVPKPNGSRRGKGFTVRIEIEEMQKFLAKCGARHAADRLAHFLAGLHPPHPR